MSKWIYSFANQQIKLKKGWNLISIPLRSTQTVNELFSELKEGSLWGFENDQYLRIEDSDTLQPGKGYWIYAKTNGFSPEITGVTVNPDLDITTNKWSLIGLSEGREFNFNKRCKLWKWKDLCYQAIDSKNTEQNAGYWSKILAVNIINSLKAPENFSFNSWITKTVLPPNNNFQSTLPFRKFSLKNAEGKTLKNSFTDEEGAFTNSAKCFIGEKISLDWLSADSANTRTDSDADGIADSIDDFQKIHN
ncbi:MAG: hypothetical protein U9O87_02905 [Verrucomicrobiota bacterium]|nr:hypothetical protein [Verrucomicrobiota bacterium]